MLKLFALILVSALCTVASAVAQSESDDWRLLFAEGSADTLLPPDEVVFLLNIQASHLDIDSARAEHQKKLEKLMDLTKKMKIDGKYIRMDLMDIEPDYLMGGGVNGTDFNPRAFRSNSDEPELQEYHVTRSIAITLRDLSKYTDFLAELLKLDISLARSPQYRISNADEIRELLVLRAMRDARRRAELLAAEVGMKVGNPIRISDADLYGADEEEYSSYRNPYAALYSSSNGTRSSLKPDMLSLSVSVSITFQMEAKES